MAPTALQAGAARASRPGVSASRIRSNQRIMARFQLLVGSAAFWQRARADIAAAKQRVLVQAMTFEGDATGLAVTQAIDQSPATDRRVLVDTYSRYIVSDRFVFSPFARRDPNFREEVRQTTAMFERLRERGATVVFTNPLGFLGSRLAARNHKKLLVMDDVAYVGGINFSDHNFAWHDLMVRCDDKAIADFLAADFTHTQEDTPRSGEGSFPDALFLSLSGADNGVLFARLFDRIDSARERIDVFSPYLTFPFCEALARARQRGVAVRLFTPLANNKGVVRDYLLWAAKRFGFSVRLYEGMSHLKAMLIDDRELVVGSSNFDFVSYHAQAEFVAILSDPQVVADFREQVLARDHAGSSEPSEVDGLQGRVAFTMLKVAEQVARFGGSRLRARFDAARISQWPRRPSPETV
jgi:cardiolipin synthase